MSKGTNCEECWYWEYDEELDDCWCVMDIDEDEFVRIFSREKPVCPYFRQSDDYYLSKKQ